MRCHVGVEGEALAQERQGPPTALAARVKDGERTSRKQEQACEQAYKQRCCHKNTRHQAGSTGSIRQQQGERSRDEHRPPYDALLETQGAGLIAEQILQRVGCAQQQDSQDGAQQKAAAERERKQCFVSTF